MLIAFLAVLGNASTWSEMEQFGHAKERWLKKFIKLKNGIPSHDTFRRVFSLIDSEQLQKATVEFLIENINAIKKSLPVDKEELRLICVDGKEQRGTCGSKGDYLGGLKGNQAGLLEEAEAYFNAQDLFDYYKPKGIISNPRKKLMAR